MAATATATTGTVAAIPKGPKSFKAGEQCTYCPLFGRCDASRDILAQIGALVAGLMTPDQVTAEQRALFLACQKPIADAFAWLILDGTSQVDRLLLDLSWIAK
jgi:hypothetical protein